MQVNSVTNLNKDEALKNARVFLRLDLNVPMDGDKILDRTRIEESLPTLKYLIESGCKLVVASHLGRPKGKPDKAFSLESVGVVLAELLSCEVLFVHDNMQEPLAYMLDRLAPGQILLLENLRFHPGETDNDRSYAEHFAEGVDFFVNDAFGTMHRAHASTVGIPEIVGRRKSAAGFLVEKEIAALSPLLKHTKSPYTVVMGGAKVSDKIGVIMTLLENCNHLIIGGAMAYTFLYEKGIKVGKSRIEADKLDIVRQIFKAADKRRVYIHLPEDHVVAEEFNEEAQSHVTEDANIEDGWMGLDIGPKTIANYTKIISQSKVVFWNGPMGVFEWEQFSKGTMAVAQSISECGATTVVGGGDSVAALNQAGLEDKISHVSTGGGASLEFLEGKVLPGIQVLLAQ